MKTINATINVPDSKAPDARAALEKNLHVLAQSLKLRNRNRDAYTVAVGEFLHVTDDERNTILAALRYYQHCSMGEPDNRPDWLQDIACPDPDNCTSLDETEISELCERINTANTSSLLLACYVALDSLQQLAETAGDVEEFNDGGHARDACRILRNAIGR
jgi:hypothetical protein